MSQINEMKAFLAVTETGSFVAAAEKSGVSTTALSRWVMQLEQRLGVRLLHRTTRRLSLTVEGERFAERCSDILQQLAEAEAELSAQASQISGRLRLNVPVSYGIRFLAPLWASFKQQNPAIELDVVLTDRLTDMVEEGFDLAVRIGRPASSSLISRPLHQLKMQLCAAPEYIHTAGLPTEPSELSAHKVIAYSYWGSGNDWSFSGPKGNMTVRTKAWMHCNNGETCVAVAESGGGVIYQPDFLVEQALQQGRLITLCPEYQGLTLPVCAVYPSRRFVSAKVRNIVSFLQKHLAR
ncbi:LysR family transcriptional regulator [Shewanella xiamenensis]|uniref:LysR family transcriptional regulator n=1 Tax=Shewanella xiamenensis TaxID=332186 RepID=UPI00313BDAF4